MLFRTSAACCVLVLAAVSTSSAQVIQLPTFQFFTVSTTVSVPVSGGAYLGGVNRARYGTTSRGMPGISKIPGAGRLFTNRGSGSSVTSSGAGVTATIIDHAEMDALLLSEAAARRASRTGLSETDRKALVLSSHIGGPAASSLRLTPDAPRESVADIRRRNAAAARAHDAEMLEYWERGQQAESLGRWGAARVSYDVIVRRSSGELRHRAVARLADLRNKAQSKRSRPMTTRHEPASHSTGAPGRARVASQDEAEAALPVPSKTVP